MKRVFLSFAAEDLSRVKNLLPSLSAGGYEFDFYDGTPGAEFDSPEAEAAKRKIGEKIVGSSVTVCLIGENTHKDKWVSCALEKSLNKGNKIIAMALKRVEAAVLPEAIRGQAVKFYPWNPKKLAELIEAL
jgi:hypothetical protein